MITLRKSQERGHANHGWLDSYHTFSFADYNDPDHVSFRALRVINEDVVAPGEGFGMHPHRDMEILTYVLDGALEHQDSMGSREILRPGEIQYMSAGTGVMHSEYNASKTDPVHLLQIWILPEARGVKPAYGQRAFPEIQSAGQLVLVASGRKADGGEESGDGKDEAAANGHTQPVRIRQDVGLYAAKLDGGQSVRHELAAGRHAWVQVARGAVRVNGQLLSQGDAAAVSQEEAVEVMAENGAAEFLLFDLS